MYPTAHFALSLPALFLVSPFFATLIGATAQETESDRVVFADSIKEISVNAPASGPRIIRQALTADELATPLDFEVSLSMPHFDELEARLQGGQTISRAELEASYLPPKTEYERVLAWLRSEGFTITLRDLNHTNIFARGSVASISRVLNVAFSRVATVDGEFTSAVTAPSLPRDIAGAVLGIDGLQPHILMHGGKRQPDAVSSVGGRVTPMDMLAAYNVPSTLNGSGQTIAIIWDALPQLSDLTAFWQAAGVNEVQTSFTTVNVEGGAIPAGQSSGAAEISLSSEWATGMAPGAQLRVYAVPSPTLANITAACTQIANDGIAKVVSCVGGFLETDLSAAAVAASSQTFAQMAAAGITVLFGSGDDGSTAYPDGSLGYDASGVLTVFYPASDPNVTGVGGTEPTFDASGNVTDETAWSEIGSPTAHDPLATGGGISGLFSRPSWQSGPGVPVGTMRCVPDVSAIAYANPTTGLGGVFVVVNGNAASTGGYGVSLSTPLWAGLVAVIDQGRADAGLPSLGLLGPWIYPLIGSNAFKDITTGNNGAYSAGVGYDLCTGVGTPNVANLISALTPAVAPSFTELPTSQTVASGRSVVFNAAATGNPAPTYQWTLNGSTTIPGITVTTDPILLITGAMTADLGTIACTATNSAGSVSASATLAITTTSNPGYLTNLSGRGVVGSGAASALFGGFGIAGTGAKQLLIRGIGPSLAMPPFNLTGFLPDTQLMLYNSVPVVINQNSPWGGTAALVAADAVTGAYPVPGNSLDSMLYLPLTPASYSAAVSGVGSATGIAVVEIYDADAPPPSTRLVNVSVRAPVGTGNNILFGGFVIGGSTAEAVLIRAVGPSLALSPFNLTGVLAQPVLTLFAGNTPIYSDTVWGGDPALVTAEAVVGAYPIPTNSQDSLLLVTLSPGTYSAQISGVNGSAGIAAVEIYEVQ